jgi:hypothetical protein
MPGQRGRIISAMADARDFSVILFLVLVAISAYLATTRAISGAALGWCLLASAVSVGLIRNVDRLEELAFRRGDDQVLVKIRQIQQDVYAKVEEVRRMSKATASFTVDSIVSANRFAGDDHQEQMLRRGAEVDAFLREAGVPEAERADLVRPIILTVARDYRRRVIAETRPAVVNAMPSTHREQVIEEITSLLNHDGHRLDKLANVIAAADRHELTWPSFRKAIETYRDFLKHHPEIAEGASPS